MTTEIAPSPEARKIYSMMVARADQNDGELHLTLAQSIQLSCQLSRKGKDGQAVMEVTELSEAAWISPQPDGGWALGV